MEQLFKDFLEAISPALQALMLGLVTIILGQVSLYVKTKWNLVQKELSSEKRYFLNLVVSNAVDTVEQLYKTASNVEKKEAAIDIIEKTLSSYGVTMDFDLIANAIEAEIFSRKPQTTALG